jgi:hypothetical protein
MQEIRERFSAAAMNESMPVSSQSPSVRCGQLALFRRSFLDCFQDKYCRTFPFLPVLAGVLILLTVVLFTNNVSIIGSTISRLSRNQKGNKKTQKSFYLTG